MPRLCALIVLAMWYSNQVPMARAQDADGAESLEEIVVTAPRTLQSMRTDILRAEDNVLALFNELNENPDYDIVCRRETPLGSHIPVRVCRPRFAMRLEAAATQDSLSLGDGLDAWVYERAVDAREHNEELEARLGALADGHPGLNAALLEYYQAKTRYEAERKERFENNWFAR